MCIPREFGNPYASRNTPVRRNLLKALKAVLNQKHTFGCLHRGFKAGVAVGWTAPGVGDKRNRLVDGESLAKDTCFRDFKNAQLPCGSSQGT